MSAQWQFYIQQPTDLIHNPIASEFFSTEAVGNVAEALIRESIQNTLDARKTNPDGSRVEARARVYLSETASALSPEKARRWFGTLWPHVTANGNGLRNQPKNDEPCPFLVFEDFGTIGLTGDPGAYQVTPGVANHFLNFFRAEGHSDKGEHDRGSWGVGKTVFPRTSRISSFVGLTVRTDDNKPLLMGRSILKFHQVNETHYKSDGYFGEQSGADSLMLPTSDPATLNEFRNDFGIARQAETGLSIVVPWYEINGDDGICRNKVIAAVLRGFFYPILKGHLVITVATPEGEITLSADSIVATVEALGGALASELLPLVRLAEWARTRTPTDFQTLAVPAPDGAQQWTPELVSPDLARIIRLSLGKHDRIALRVPLYIEPRTSGPQQSSFDIFLEGSPDDRERPVFIRDELIISDVKSQRVSQARSLVIVEDQALATLLRDAETPAHTQWNPGTSHFKNKYKFGPGVIKFVSYSVAELLRIVNQAEQEPDPTITVDFFSIPSLSDDDEDEPTATRRRKPRPSPGDGPTPPPAPLVPRLRRFRIGRLKGGFSVRSGDPNAAMPPLIDIRVAYDVRRGNPLRKYDEADFDLNSEPIRYEAKGVVVKSAAANRMVITVAEPDFTLDVSGFDPDRDLYVKAEVKESVDVD